MMTIQTQTKSAPESALDIRLAHNGDDLKAAQRLR